MFYDSFKKLKNQLLLIVFLFIVSACKQETKPVIGVDYSQEKLDVTTSIYPEDIAKTLNAHGQIDQWNTFNTLVFTMKKTTGDEITTTDLKDRRALIETNDFKIGYAGDEAWLINKGDNKYEGNPQFYYNLMFYFYAMPFVLADDGITYTNVEPLNAGGKEYPGIKISYGESIGESPEDEYIMYYDAETNKMAWLAYTITFFTKEKSKDWHFIKYVDWQTIKGMVLPKTLEWYKSDVFTIGEKRKDLLITDVSLSKNKLEKDFFKNPEKE
ncbi:MAG: hypothetical protein QNK89_08575 [Lacinutrix sp.]|uniref:DUF6503 family protein n=1 Tax=Lacinutrix sp. TaxID=1937692 RepID=UPI0030A0B4C2